MFDRALFQRYLEFFDKLGLACIPLKYGDKIPLVAWKNQRYEAFKMDISTFDWWAEYNIGVVCGSVSGNLLAFDFDHTNEKPPVSDTITVKTSRGFHVWLRLEKPVAFTNNRRGLDIKWNGYVVAPPSLHPSGHVYTFINNPRKIRTVTDMPEAFKLLGLKPPRIRLDKDPQPANEGQVPQMPEWMERVWNEPCYEGQRHRFGLIYSSYWARKEPYGRGVKDKNVILEHLARWNRLRCNPPMNERDLPHIVYMALRTPYTFLRNPYE